MKTTASEPIPIKPDLRWPALWRNGGSIHYQGTKGGDIILLHDDNPCRLSATHHRVETPENHGYERITTPVTITFTP